jgi:hypothetical protein
MASSTISKNERLWYFILLSPIILLKIYYDKLAGKIKINNIFSKLFRLIRGVKQGGVHSGVLFNFLLMI